MAEEPLESHGQEQDLQEEITSEELQQLDLISRRTIS